MEHAVRNIDLQFDYRPTIENKNSLRPAGSFVVGGMGGSHLAADLLRVFKPDLDMYIHQDYGLPVLAQRKFSTSLYIASSYSGNTEETLDFAERAHAAGFNLAVISTGGLLIDFARKNHVPYIQLPDTGIQPRSAIGYSLLAFATLIGDESLISDLRVLGLKLKKDRIEKSDELEKRGAVLAYEMRGKVPVVYASRKNWALAYNWKIKFNETAKIPAFCNVLPELNHNEMTGFDVVPGTADLCSKFFFIFLGDDTDSPAIKHRMEVLKNLYRKRGLDGIQVAFSQSTQYAQIFESLLLADWTAISLSKIYGTEPEKVPMVEEFKHLMKQ